MFKINQAEQKLILPQPDFVYNKNVKNKAVCRQVNLSAHGYINGCFKE